MDSKREQTIKPVTNFLKGNRIKSLSAFLQLTILWLLKISPSWNECLHSTEIKTKENKIYHLEYFSSLKNRDMINH